MKNKKLMALKAAFPKTIPVFMGYLFLGCAFGVSLTKSGYHYGWAILMSCTIYAGSGQFLGVSILNSSYNLVSAAFMTLMVNLRHIFYGLSMFDKFDNMGIKKPYMIFSLTDETYSLLFSTKPEEGVDEKCFYFFIALLNQSYWILGSTIGAVAGYVLDFNSKGIDFAMTALFVVIFVEQWENAKTHLPSILGLGISTICLLVFGVEYFIAFSMLGILVSLLVFKKHIEERQVDKNA